MKLYAAVKGMTQLYVDEMISETLSLQSKVQCLQHGTFCVKNKGFWDGILPAYAKRNTERGRKYWFLVATAGRN